MDSFRRGRGDVGGDVGGGIEAAAVRFDGLVREHHRSIHNHVRVCYPSAHEAAVVNAVFALLWQHLDEIPPEAVRTWLRVAARHEVLNASREEQRWYALGDRVARLGPGEWESSSEIDHRIELEAVMSALSTLSPDDRGVLVMSAFDGLTSIELAKILGIEPAAVKTRLSRARARLRIAVQQIERWPTEEKRHEQRPV